MINEKDVAAINQQIESDFNELLLTLKCHRKRVPELVETLNRLFATLFNAIQKNGHTAIYFYYQLSLAISDIRNAIFTKGQAKCNSNFIQEVAAISEDLKGKEEITLEFLRILHAAINGHYISAIEPYLTSLECDKSKKDRLTIFKDKIQAFLLESNGYEDQFALKSRSLLHANKVIGAGNAPISKSNGRNTSSDVNENKRTKRQRRME